MASPTTPRLTAREPFLTIDETTAHVAVAAEQAEELLAWFQAASLSCTRRRGGAAGLDAIDFGNPSPAEEKQIRAVFAAWLRRR